MIVFYLTQPSHKQIDCFDIEKLNAQGNANIILHVPIFTVTFLWGKSFMSKFLMLTRVLAMGQ